MGNYAGSRAEYDWVALKTEYVTGQISYNGLCKKYNIPYRTLADHGKAENWRAEREKYRAEAVQNARDFAKEKQLALTESYFETAGRLLERISEAVGTEVAPKELRSLTAAMLDVGEMLGIQSEVKKRETEARIAHLEMARKAQEAESRDITVRILDGLEEYAE